MKIRISLLLALTLALSGCGQAESTEDTWSDAVRIEFSDDSVTVDGNAASADSAVYTENDIIFYLEGQGVTYGEGTEADAHSQAEADAHTVVHITQPGTYVLSGELSAGQIAVDLGEGAETDPEAVVTLVLDGVDITCTVAPAVMFYRVYECGSTDGDAASWEVDTSAAGANIMIADGTENTIRGSYVARIYDPESVTLSEDGTEVEDAKKLHKYDGAFYSRMSMNVSGGAAGTGVLNIYGENEGLDTELHLTIQSGVINIFSGNDGINTNEDGVSVTTINGGALSIQVTGETGEGDGIDSNGYLVINGGTVTAAACSQSADAGLDADKGILINGGTVTASGNMLDNIETGGQNYAVFSFTSRQSGGTYRLKDNSGGTVLEWTPTNDFTSLLVSSPELAPGEYTLWCGEVQLAGSAGQRDGHPDGRPGGAEDGDIPEPSDNGVEAPPENAGTERPEFSQRPEQAGEEVPAGERPQHPGNGELSEPLDGERASKRSEVFTIQEGASFFQSIAPLAE